MRKVQRQKTFQYGSIRTNLKTHAKHIIYFIHHPCLSWEIELIKNEKISKKEASPKQRYTLAKN
jgi:hypothetical protein